MIPRQRVIALSLSSLLLFGFAACGEKQVAESLGPENAAVNETIQTLPSEELNQLPVRYQRPVFITENDQAYAATGKDEEYEVKVGANITSTQGPQPLWDIMKRLTKMKGMNVSWANDVDRNSMVDVDIKANDGFFNAITNLLRQVDYYYEEKNDTIIVKFKDTRKYRIAIPNLEQSYTSEIGGNFLSRSDSGTDGTIQLDSVDNQFRIWENIKLNLDTILNIWTGRRAAESLNTYETNRSWDKEGNFIKSIKEQGIKPKDLTGEQAGGSDEAQAQVSGQSSTSGTAPHLIEGGEYSRESQGSAAGSGSSAYQFGSQSMASLWEEMNKSFYIVDKHLGIITVTAPPTLQEQVAGYLGNLQKELYRQVVIEAKIVEVYLQDNSKIGLDWSAVLKDFNITGTLTFGDPARGGQVYPYDSTQGFDLDPRGRDLTRFVSKVAFDPANFSVMLNALNEQGDAKVLSNPKIAVLNGQPALISIGTDVTYIKKIERTDNGTGADLTSTFSAEVGNVVEGIALGIVPSIKNKNSVVLNLTPVTTEIVGGEIEYRSLNPQADGSQIGLPVIRVREMSTMVEVDDGEMLIIGGLIDEVKGTDSKMLPIVGKIPFIKYLFGYEEKQLERRELVILLTPHIL